MCIESRRTRGGRTCVTFVTFNSVRAEHNSKSFVRTSSRPGCTDRDSSGIEFAKQGSTWRRRDRNDNVGFY